MQIVRFAGRISRDFQNMIDFMRLATEITKKSLECFPERRSIRDFILAFIVSSTALLAFIIYASESQREQLYGCDFRNRRLRTNIVHRFAYVSKKNIIHVDCTGIVITREKNPRLKMEQLIWHEMVISYRDWEVPNVIAITRDAAGSRLKIIEEYLPRCLAMIVIDYMFKRLRKRRNARQL